MFSTLLTRIGHNRLLQNKSNYLRLLATIGIFLTSAILAPRIALGNQNPTLLILLFAGVISAFTLLRFPSLGLIGLVITSLVVPFGIGTGSQTGIHAAVLLLGLLFGLWVIDMIVVQRRIHMVSSRPVFPLLALMIVAILAFGFGQLYWFPTQAASLRAQIAGLAIFLLAAIAFLLVANQAHDLRILKWMTWTFFGLSALYIAGRFQPNFGNYVLRFFQSGATGSLFWTWLLALGFSQAAFNKRLSILWRFLIGILVFCTLYVSMVFGRSWVSGWLPPIVAIVVIILIVKPRLGLLACIVAIGFLVIFSQKTTALVVNENEYSIVTRFEAWQIVLDIIKVNPFFGVGPANYYSYASLFPIEGYYVPFNSHNNYVDIVAQIGLLGLACFFWFAWEVGRLGWQLHSRVPEGFARAYVLGALGGLAGTLASGMLGDWVIPFVYNIGLEGFRASIFAWLFLGGLVVIEHLYIKPGNPHENIMPD